MSIGKMPGAGEVLPAGQTVVWAEFWASMGGIPQWFARLPWMADMADEIRKGTGK